MTHITQDQESLDFGDGELKTSCEGNFYRENSPEAAQKVEDRGFLNNSSFVVEQGDKPDRKGRFIVNMSRSSKGWNHRPMSMERLKELTVYLQKDERLLSLDLVAGYRHLALHLIMLD